MITYSKDDVSYELARDAHRGISFKAEERAEQVQASYVQEMDAVVEVFSVFVTEGNAHQIKDAQEQSDYHREKARRKEYYLKYVYGWRLRTCTACNGSGSYDHNGSPRCSCCEGTGKERYQGQKALLGRG